MTAFERPDPFVSILNSPPASAVAINVPAIAQSKHSSCNPEGVGIVGNQWRFKLPNAVGAGNCLVLFITHPWSASRVVTITDDRGNAWPSSPSATANPGGAGYQSSCYILPNAAAGVTTITVTIDTVSNISSINQLANTVTVNATGHGLARGQTAIIAGVPVNAYNGAWVVTGVITADSFQYDNPPGGLQASSGGNAMLGVIPFQYSLFEAYNVALAAPLNGSSVSVGQRGPNLSTGSFTPGANDSAGGNLILSYFGLGQIANTNVTTWLAGAKFILADGDSSWTNRQGFPHASQQYLQPTAAAVNPSMVSSGDSGNFYNGISIALRGAPGIGTPPPAGIRINKVISLTTNRPPASWRVQFPCSGNLLVCAANEPNVCNITRISDTMGNAWVVQSLDSATPQIWYATGSSSGTALVMTVSIQGAPQHVTLVLYDISGAAANAFGASAGLTAQNVSGLTQLQHCPDITPTQINGLVIARSVIGIGPVFDSPSPAGAIDDFVRYANQGISGIDLMDNADGASHFYNL